ncbi:hypothetical protein DAPPUDRAFT_253975 [Daphnia pulex]|uniref:Uncharacterized protein n=1 Tax=Daphnia pulex TaxID=6669 RepID=E9H627_DAPPU|nr:hypothetical protein DAPPUDRAFT_253975 [Daphnia pulex]|eukprot:EFX72826.1 hypothetical protein DAPPUDRAFT_253975 [Daphnia pulex]
MKESQEISDFHSSICFPLLREFLKRPNGANKFSSSWQTCRLNGPVSMSTLLMKVNLLWPDLRCRGVVFMDLCWWWYHSTMPSLE